MVFQIGKGIKRKSRGYLTRSKESEADSEKDCFRECMQSSGELSWGCGFEEAEGSARITKSESTET
ncbi:unnamed protein product [Arabis nemorensis]|uniref:Uncharacterized protein n=1 Tax=Arabis nemorensis TaxID=586526 RepID=A0A565AY54_9BRAS|nr:unnamed protein product [Arabis nemorensis]